VNVTGGTERLEVRSLSKRFGANRALREVSLSIAPGEIHGLVGQNGSGKSTFAKLLSGFHAPEPGGELYVDGVALRLPTRPHELRRHGVAVVHQDLGLVDRATVVENMRVGSYSVNPWTRAIGWRRERELARAAIADLGHDIDPMARAGELSAAARATVAIARALQYQEPGRGLVMFDESTRALPRETLEHFYSLVRQISRRGGSVLLVSHHLDEVLALTDRITVLRDGAVVAAALDSSGLTEAGLVELMLGRALEPHVAASHARARPAAGVSVTAEHVSGQLVTDVSLSVERGEIVGVTGLVGSGYEELPYLLAGASPARGGVLTLGEHSYELAHASPRKMLQAGVTLVPERRAEQGLALSLTVRKNVTLPRVATRGGALRIGSGWERTEARAVIDELDVRPSDENYTVGQLSGGNQQKVLLGKWLRSSPKLMLLHEPTQGVDVGARHDLLAAVRRSAAGGSAMIVASIDPAELAAICDRIVILRDGLRAHELSGQIDADDIVLAVYGASSKSILQKAGAY
jgi:ribose transport system ATP-binding protein